MNLEDRLLSVTVDIYLLTRYKSSTLLIMLAATARDNPIHLTIKLYLSTISYDPRTSRNSMIHTIDDQVH